MAEGAPGRESVRGQDPAKVVVGKKARAHLDANGCYVLLLELASDVTLHEGGLADTAITHEQTLELGDFLLDSLRRRGAQGRFTLWGAASRAGLVSRGV
jgi:hypothetical protein